MHSDNRRLTGSWYAHRISSWPADKLVTVVVFAVRPLILRVLLKLTSAPVNHTSEVPKHSDYNQLFIFS